MEKLKLIECSEIIAKELIRKGYTPDYSDLIDARTLREQCPSLPLLIDVSKELYEAFNEEDTLLYFRSLLKFDMTYFSKIE